MTESFAGVEALLQTVERLQNERDEDRAMLEEMQSLLISGVPARHMERRYPDWISWVDEWLTARVSRSPKRTRWCRRYAEHPEVADRLEALWHAWELAWPDPASRLGWFRDGLDHQLGVIGSDDGPLRDCSAIEQEHLLPPTLYRVRTDGATVHLAASDVPTARVEAGEGSAQAGQC